MEIVFDFMSELEPNITREHDFWGLDPEEHLFYYVSVNSPSYPLLILAQVYPNRAFVSYLPRYFRGSILRFEYHLTLLPRELNFYLPAPPVQRFPAGMYFSGNFKFNFSAPPSATPPEGYLFLFVWTRKFNSPNCKKTLFSPQNSPFSRKTGQNAAFSNSILEKICRNSQFTIRHSLLPG
jgi:hypothetical protein